MSKRRPRPSANGDFELRHWRSTRRKPRPSTLIVENGKKHCSQFAEISLLSNDNEDEGYISLRDILASPEYAEVSSPGRGGSWPEINISNPLVKHAAYAYLQPTPSAREVSRRRMVGVKRVISEIFSPCLEFLGVIFNFRR